MATGRWGLSECRPGNRPKAFGILDMRQVQPLSQPSISPVPPLPCQQSPQPLTVSLLLMPDRDMEAQETGGSLPSGACKARDPPATLCFLLTLALAKGILESIRLCCSYGKAWRNHVIWSLAQTLAGLICQVSGPTCQWAGRVTDP